MFYRTRFCEPLLLCCGLSTSPIEHVCRLALELIIIILRNQKSECQDQYRGALPLEQDARAEQCQTSYNCGPQPPQYRQHDSNGPSKVLATVHRYVYNIIKSACIFQRFDMIEFYQIWSLSGQTFQRLIPSTHNPATAGSLYYTMDRSVLRKLDPYCTTNNQTHRPFSE